MNGPLSVATIVASLALAAWCLLRAAVNRPPGRFDLGAMAALAVLVLALVATAVASLFGDDRPAEPATFAGYLITTVCVPPTGWWLARMEPTRWGSALIGGAAVLVPVLVLRLQQVHG